MNKSLSARILLGVSVFCTLSCDRPELKKSSLKIQFPKLKVAANTNTAGIGSSSISTGFSGSFPINCYIIFVSGPEPEMQRNFCERKNDGAFTPRKVGLWAGGTSAGGTLAIDVPAGNDRVVMIAGFYAQNGSCVNFRNGLNSGLSRPYLLGETGPVNLIGGQTAEVAVNMNFAATNWFDNCQGPDFNMNIPKTNSGTSFLSLNQAGANQIQTSNGQYSANIVIHGGNQLKEMSSTNGKYRIQNVQISR